MKPRAQKKKIQKFTPACVDPILGPPGASADADWLRWKNQWGGPEIQPAAGLQNADAWWDSLSHDQKKCLITTVVWLRAVKDPELAWFLIRCFRAVDRLHRKRKESVLRHLGMLRLIRRIHRTHPVLN